MGISNGEALSSSYKYRERRSKRLVGANGYVGIFIKFRERERERERETERVEGQITFT